LTLLAMAQGGRDHSGSVSQAHSGKSLPRIF
jgi:hypothetical protein